MRRYLVPILMVLVFTVFGCSQSEESKPAPTEKETATEKMAEAAKTAAGEVKEAAEAVADKAGEMEKQAEPAVKDAAEDVKETMAEAKDATAEAADTAAEKAEAAAAATTMAADKAVEEAKEAISPETIVLEASMGDVTFPHGMHSSAFECSTCHGEGTPGLFGLDKEKAHPLCRGCHKEKGAGPTACSGCHKK